jgi:hypothetical protein
MIDPRVIDLWTRRPYAGSVPVLSWALVWPMGSWWPIWMMVTI